MIYRVDYTDEVPVGKAGIAIIAGGTTNAGSSLINMGNANDNDYNQIVSVYDSVTANDADAYISFVVVATTTQAKIYGNGIAWFIDNVSAGSFTDRTPFYEGDALAEIKKIKGVNGQIDHASLPDFARKTTIHPIHEEQEVEIEVENEEKGKVEKQIVKQPVKVGERIEEGRDIGAMISILTVAVQQLLTRVEALENK